MSFKDASLAIGSTIAPSGGTATTVISRGMQNGVNRYVLDDSSEFLDSVQFSLSHTEPKPAAGAPNGYTQKRTKLSILVPMTLTNGNRTVRTVRVEIGDDIESSDAEQDSLMDLAALVILSSAFRAAVHDQIND